MLNELFSFFMMNAFIHFIINNEIIHRFWDSVIKSGEPLLHSTTIVNSFGGP
jgi:hypothetical protein